MKALPLGIVASHVLLGSVGRGFLRLSKHTAGGTGMPTLTFSHIIAQGMSESKEEEWTERIEETKKTLD
jgi:hypothetical protein